MPFAASDTGATSRAPQAGQFTARFRYDRDIRYYTNGFRVARSVP